MSNARQLDHGTGPFTFGDSRLWPEDERWELVRGEAWAMAPAPTWDHQALSMILSRELGIFLKGKPCRPFAAPTDVFLPEAGESADAPDGISTVVQPDLGVVCDPAKITRHGVMGAPDVVIEIISPASVIRDLNLKKQLYGRHGCREYWIFDARLDWATRLVRQADGTWDEGTGWDRDGIAESLALPGFRLDLRELRAELGLKD
jgi:Uma2 family endonuclease